ncbi:MAG TPA: hypothetical protein VFO60_01545 [Candidatus Dormibacteraeota bacterium]|nr:hypothetical protein [Candidatus Dormibacteraeota bacterium]
MSLAPRAVVIHRRTELDELLARHGTHGQAAFFLRGRGRSMAEVELRHAAQEAALRAVSSAIPVDWRRGAVERADLARFLFAADDVVVAVGQDGLVANVAKYLDGQCVVGVNPDPARNPGVLVPHAPDAAGPPILAAAGAAGRRRIEALTMVEAVSDDGQRLLALNEVFLGQAGHQTARYALRIPNGRTERQASSGLLVGTGTGATGWCRSAWLERHSTLALPRPTDQDLAWFVREAWPSPATGATLTEGALGSGEALRVTVDSDRLVAFGDGVETDALALTWGQSIEIRAASRTLHLVR